MPRGPRLDTKGALHHVMGRGIEKRKIFLTDIDRADFIERLGNNVLRSGAQVYAWAFLPNHFHLLIRTGSLPLSSLMRRVLTGYSVSFNHRHKRIGHLFQNRYKSVLVEEEPYLLELVRYIHLNPLRTNEVADIQALEDYLWSGHGAILGKRRNPWQDTHYILEQFGSRSNKARRAYREFVETGIQRGNRPDLSGGGLRRSLGLLEKVEELRRGREKWSFDERVLGRSEFVERVLQEAEGENREQEKGPKGSNFREVIQKVASRFHLSEAEIVGGSRRKEVVVLRNLLSHIGVRGLGMKLTEVSRELGVSKQSVLRGIESGGAEMKNRGLTGIDFF